jgi:uncharacterized membrane protein YbjE (DUF340 family)
MVSCPKISSLAIHQGSTSFGSPQEIVLAASSMVIGLVLTQTLEFKTPTSGYRLLMFLVAAGGIHLRDNFS